MKDRLFQRFHRLFLFVCCAALTLLNGHARAQEEKLIETSAKAAVLIEKNTGRVLYRCNEETALPMASTTKVMTALLALEEGNLDDVVTVSRNAFGVPGTSIYLSEGEKITLRDLLYGLMLASGNDAAVAIAEHIGGSVDAFCCRMTERATELGCQNTVFLSPNGLPTPGHHGLRSGTDRPGGHEPPRISGDRLHPPGFHPVGRPKLFPHPQQQKPPAGRL